MELPSCPTSSEASSRELAFERGAKPSRSWASSPALLSDSTPAKLRWSPGEARPGDFVDFWFEEGHQRNASPVKADGCCEPVSPRGEGGCGRHPQGGPAPQPAGRWGGSGFPRVNPSLRPGPAAGRTTRVRGRPVRNLATRRASRRLRPGRYCGLPPGIVSRPLRPESQFGLPHGVAPRPMGLIGPRLAARTIPELSSGFTLPAPGEGGNPCEIRPIRPLTTFRGDGGVRSGRPCGRGAQDPWRVASGAFSD